MERQIRYFGVEAERRSRRAFAAVVSGIALLAILAGFFTAYCIYTSSPSAPDLPRVGPRAGAPVEPLPGLEPLTWLEPKPEAAPRKRTSASSAPRGTLADDDLARGWRRLAHRFDDCGRRHGGLNGMIVRIDFSVDASGRVSRALARPPHHRTPLGRCVSDVVFDHARFPPSRDGRRDVHETVVLAP